ncbi:FecR domain-containing protein [candidate division WWE3 bacterium]|uniref:FecR domain-containing protein n=1 Tax=candidate division WWE3 bacterium TaxID=2053526 RepID=A0A955EDP7_UNCKA|nr:FecR domain-containing protein [candidate division WWE3 bacterium]
MKKIALFLQILIVVSLLALFGYKSIVSNPEEVQGLNAVNGEDNFTLYVERGEVLYKTADDYVRVTESQIELPNHTYVRTQNGIAHVLLPDNSIISVDENTTIQVNFKPEGILIKQFFGNTWHRVKNLVEIGSYKVETDNTIAAVRGTVFGVSVDQNNDTKVFVVESKVSVSKVTQENNKVKVVDEKLLETDNYVEVKNEEAEELEVTAIPQDLKNTNWFNENKKIDHKIEVEGAPNVVKQMKDSAEETEDTNKTTTDIETDQTNKTETTKATKKETKTNVILASNDSENDEATTTTTETKKVEVNSKHDPVQIRLEACEQGTLFRIGDKDDRMENPSNEFNWAKDLNFYADYKSKFVVGKNSASDFPWTANASKGYATNLNIEFDYKGNDNSKAVLKLAWTPGQGGKEQKEITINNAYTARTPERVGIPTKDWWKNMPRFKDEFEVNLRHGTNNINLKHLIGNGAAWDYVEVEVTDPKCATQQENDQNNQDTNNENGDTGDDEDENQNNDTNLGEFDLDLGDGGVITTNTSGTGPYLLIGDIEGKGENPVDEFNWSGDFTLMPEYETTFIVGETSESLFPWNSNFEEGIAEEIKLVIDTTDLGPKKGTLTLGWGAGRTSTVEQKEVYLDGEFVGVTEPRTGSVNPDWWEGIERSTDTFELDLSTPGNYVITIKQISGDGSIWDFIQLDLEDGETIEIIDPNNPDDEEILDDNNEDNNEEDNDLLDDDTNETGLFLDLNNGESSEDDSFSLGEEDNFPEDEGETENNNQEDNSQNGNNNSNNSGNQNTQDSPDLDLGNEEDDVPGLGLGLSNNPNNNAGGNSNGNNSNGLTHSNNGQSGEDSPIDLEEDLNAPPLGAFGL